MSNFSFIEKSDSNMDSNNNYSEVNFSDSEKKSNKNYSEVNLSDSEKKKSKKNYSEAKVIATESPAVPVVSPSVPVVSPVESSVSVTPKYVSRKNGGCMNPIVKLILMCVIGVFLYKKIFNKKRIGLSGFYFIPKELTNYK